MSMNIEELKRLAEEFKEPTELLIEKTKEYDLAFIESKGGRRFTEKEINTLRENLKAISRSHDELRLINEFVEFVESEFGEGET